MVQGIQLALDEAGNKAGDVTIKYESLDDSTAQAGNWDPGQTAQNARKVAQDDAAVGYIGEFNSGASAISIPILNEAGVPQVSPANTYVGLTTDEPGSEKGEPAKYYPTGNRTYLRIVPRDTVQSAALLTLMKQDGCTKVAVANDKDTYGAGLARLMEIQAPDVGVTISSNEGIDKSAANFRSYASKIKGEGADCFVFSGVTANGAVQIYKDVAAALPDAKLYGPDGVCESGFTNPSKGGIPKSVGANFKCSVATLDLESYPGGRSSWTRSRRSTAARRLTRTPSTATRQPSCSSTRWPAWATRRPTRKPSCRRCSTPRTVTRPWARTRSMRTVTRP